MGTSQSRADFYCQAPKSASSSEEKNVPMTQ